MKKYRVGDIVEAKITKIESYGAFAQIDDDYSGLIHISELTEKFVRDIHDYVGVGDIVSVKILGNVDTLHQLKLSTKQVNKSLPRSSKNKIRETVFGFYLLKSALPGWIDEKLKEIDKKN